MVDKHMASSILSQGMRVILFAAGILVGTRLPAADSASTFRPGRPWLDMGGKPIQSHCGGVLYENGTYYWYGMNFIGKTIPPGTYKGQSFSWMLNTGMSCYSSKNLRDWKYESSSLLPVPNDPKHPLHDPTTWISRPKVLRSGSTGKYVMIGTLVTIDFTTTKSIVGVADSPAGPFDYNKVLDPKGGGYDMTLYKDDDGNAYLVCAHEWVRAHLLSEDLLSIVSTTELQGVRGEAPAVFKHDGTYYFITSELTGWAPNRNKYSTSRSFLGPYSEKGHFAEGPGANDTFGGQATFVLPVANRPGAFIFLADRFNARDWAVIPDISQSTHIWLPITINPTNKTIRVPWRDTWDLSTFGTKGRGNEVLNEND